MGLTRSSRVGTSSSVADGRADLVSRLMARFNSLFELVSSAFRLTFEPRRLVVIATRKLVSFVSVCVLVFAPRHCRRASALTWVARFALDASRGTDSPCALVARGATAAPAGVALAGGPTEASEGGVGASQRR